MTDDFDEVFGTRVTRPKFTDQLRPRREPEATPAPLEPSVHLAGTGAYKPYGYMPAGVGEGCEVTRWVDGTLVPEGIEFQYRFLMQVGFIGDEELRLFLPDCIVVVQGRKLHELRKKLARRQATFMCQYNALVWPDRPPANDPFIERIEVVRPESVIALP